MHYDLKNDIFNKLIALHLKKGTPIGSKILKKIYFRQLADSTIRLYLKRLVLENYLMNINKGTGRIPTDKGWKYYLEINVNKVNINNWGNLNKYSLMELIEVVADKFNICYLLENKTKLIEGGFEYVVRNVELEDKNKLIELFRFFKEVKKYINKILEKDDIKVLIGGELKLAKSSLFSVLGLRKREHKIIFVGVKRLNYPVVYNLLDKIIKKRL